MFVLVAVSCSGNDNGAVSPVRHDDQSAPARAIQTVHTPPAALATCRRLRLIRPQCPRLVPVGRYLGAKPPPDYHGAAGGPSIALCADQDQRGVPISSSACRYESWILEAGAPAGLPADAPPGVPGKRLGPSRTRPPQYVHIIIYASREMLTKKLPFSWPQGRAHPVKNTLLNPKRTHPISLGWRHWAGHTGQLVLAPPLIFGGEMGDHLIFRWSAARVNYAVSLHSWAPLREAVATLKAVVGSAR